MDRNIIIGLIFIAIALWFWAIIDITRSRFKNPFMNTICLLAVLFFPILGSILYLILRKKLIAKEKRKFQPNFNRTE